MSEEVEATADEILLLKKQLAWYKSFFDNAADAMFIVQPETWSVLDANDYAAVLLGISHDEVLGTSLPQFRRIFKLLTKSNSPSVLSEISLDTPHNENLMVEISARFVEYNGQKLIQAIARDVSERQALTEKLVQADKLVLLGQLSAGVAHEIRNPLAAINLNLQLLQRKLAEAPEVALVKTALQGVERIAGIVEATLNFSRPAAPVVQEENLNSLILNSLELVAATFRRKTITVKTDLADKLPNVVIDAKQVQQVFINLLTNAADAIRAVGTVTVRTYIESGAKKSDGEYAVVTISDSGAGIPPEDLPKIFNPFFTRKPEGTGLGLPISQRIIYEHSGIIDVESTVGEGTSFYVKLPLSREAEPQESMKPPAAPYGM